MPPTVLQYCYRQRGLPDGIGISRLGSFGFPAVCDSLKRTTSTSETASFVCTAISATKGFIGMFAPPPQSPRQATDAP